jgi:hypothetical protein
MNIEIQTMGTVSAVGNVGPMSGPAELCPGALSNYSVSPVTNAVAYKWKAPPGASINGSTTNEVTIPANQGGNAVEIVWDNAGGQVQVNAIGPCNAMSNTSSKNVNVQPIFVSVSSLTVYESNLPFFWPFGGQPVTEVGTFNNFNVFSSWRGCDSLVQQWLRVVPYIQGYVFWDIDDNGVFNPTTDIPAPNVTISSFSNQYPTTNPDGKYFFPNILYNGASFKPNALPQHALNVTPASHFFNINSNTISYDFALKPIKETVTGLVYLDTNNNGILETNIDQPVNTVVVRTTSGRVAQVNNGQYVFADLAYPEKIMVETNGLYMVVGQPVLPFVPGTNTGYNFLLRNNSSFGYIYWDANLDGQYSVGEPPASNIQLTSNNTTTLSVNGLYQFPSANAGDVVTVTTPSVVATPPSQVFASTNVTGHNFLVKPTAATDLAIDLINNTVFRPGFTTKVFVDVTNGTSFAAATKVSIKKPAFLQLTSSQPSVVAAGDSLTWDLGDLPPNTARQLVLTFKTPTTTTIGTGVLVVGKVTTLFAEGPTANNSDQINAIVVGAYDPNDKQVEPATATLTDLQANNPFTYTVRFQNTGNFPADFVELIDTLSGALQWNTLRFLSSSHPCTYTLEQGVLKCFFDNIFLPASSMDEPNSHGYAKFSIRPIEGLTIGDKVENFCDIYFDYNPPIRTNTAATEVVLFGPGGNPPNETSTLSVRPNPASYFLRLSWPDPLPTDGIVRLYRPDGTVAFTEVVAEGSTHAELNTAWLPDGSYTLVLLAGPQQYVRRVVIVQGGGVRKRGG